MKKSFNIFVLATVFIIVQACAPKTEKVSEENADTVATVTSSEVKAIPTPAERRAKVEKDSATRAEKRMIAFEQTVKSSPTFTDAEGNIVYNKAEVDPSFDGGKKAMMKYFRDNLKFPKEAEERGVEGTVFVDFIVAVNGSVRQVEVSDAYGDAVDQSLRNEAIRLVTSMPKWVPGRQHGKAVQVKYSLPVTFQLI